MNPILAIAISLLVFPGLLFGLVAAGIFGYLRGMARSGASGWSGTMPGLSLGGIARRLRQGSTLPAGLYPPVMQALPVVAAICPLLVLVFLPLPANRGLDNMNYTADVVALSALLLGMPLARIVLGWATPSPYTRIAAMRSARDLLGHLLPLALAIATGAALSDALTVFGIAMNGINPALTPNAAHLIGAARIVAGLAYLACLPALTRSTSIGEGHGSLELVGGELTELSGRELFVMRLGEMLQLVAALGFGIVLFVLPFFTTDNARGLAAIITAIVVALGLGGWEGYRAQMQSQDDMAPPVSIWFGMQTFLGVGAILLLVLSQRFSQ